MPSPQVLQAAASTRSREDILAERRAYERSLLADIAALVRPVPPGHTFPATVVGIAAKVAPCPFCGAEPAVQRDVLTRPEGSHTVFCENDDCPASVQVRADTQAEAIRLWNGAWI